MHGLSPSVASGGHISIAVHWFLTAVAFLGAEQRL